MENIFWKKILINLFVSVLLVLTLVGCSSQEAKEDNDSNEINVLLMDNPYTQELKALAGEFEQETGIVANVEVVGQEVNEKRTQLEFTGKTGDIDVVYMPSIVMEKWVKADWVLSLDEYVSKSSDINIEDFIPTTLDSMKVDEHLYGLPSMAEPIVMAYRKDVFDEYGIDSPPETWHELKGVAEKIDTNDMAAVTMRGKRGQGMNMFVFPMFMWSHGGQFFKDYPDDLTPVINSKENVQALETYTDFIQNYGPSGASNYAVSDILATMTQGKAAIAIDGTSVVGQLLEEDKNPYYDQIGFAIIPGGEDFPATPGSAVHGYAISNFSNQKDNAYKFIEWATSEEIQKRLALNSSYQDFTRVSVSQDKEVLEKYNKEMMDVRLESLKLGKADYRPLIPEWAEVGDIIGAKVNEFSSGGSTPEKALEQAEKEVSDLLIRAGYSIEDAN